MTDKSKQNLTQNTTKPALPSDSKPPRDLPPLPVIPLKDEKTNKKK